MSETKSESELRHGIVPEAISRLQLDLATLQNKALHLPEEMREPFIWLGSYCREQCARDIDLLTLKFTDLKIGHEKGTWSKILRGLWNRSADGREIPSPILSVEKFLRAVQILRQDARVKELGGRIPLVKTPTVESVWNFIDAKRAPDRVNKFGVVIGETGSQKTAAISEYTRQNNHGLVVKVEAPETPSMSQFMTDLASSYGYDKQQSYLRKKAYVLSVVNFKRTVIVENIQRLYDPRTSDKQVIFSFLQKLQEDTNCTVIMTITPMFEKTLIGGLHKSFFEQFEGRAGGRRNFLRLPEWPPEEDVVMIAKAFGLRDAERHAAELVKIAHEPGRIRRLFEDLQDAKIAASAEEKPMTMAYVRAARGED